MVEMLEIYKGKKVFVTGSTGFKGSWLTSLLLKLKAEVKGFGLTPSTEPNHFDLLFSPIDTDVFDIRDRDRLKNSIVAYQPEIIFHLASQAIVKDSYTYPQYTFETNMLGTLNLLELCREVDSIKAVVIITTDKVYKPVQVGMCPNPFKENDELGANDPYSTSKACMELMTESYRNSFFNVHEYKKTHDTLIATARAGNVIGGGDWSNYRLIPDIIKNAFHGIPMEIRRPNAIRPWQFVLDALMGYLQLGSMLLEGNKIYSGAWNFSPDDVKQVTVKDILNKLSEYVKFDIVKEEVDFHEVAVLQLDSAKAQEHLNWRSVLSIDETLKWTIEWYKDFYDNQFVSTDNQIGDYLRRL